MDRHFNSIIPQQQHFQQQQQQVQQPLPPTQLVMSPSAEAPKRGRGRPRKNFASNLPQNVNLNQNLNLNIPRTQEVVENPSMIVQTDNQQNEIGDRRITRAMARAAERAALADPVAQNVVAAINREASRILQRLLIAKHGKKWIDWQTKNIPLDDFALPRQSDKTNTDWVRRRRAYLKRLTPSQRNSVLTGDPLFAYDPILYDLFFYENRLADRLAQIADNMAAPQVVNQPEVVLDPEPDPIPEDDPEQGGAVGPEIITPANSESDNDDEWHDAQQRSSDSENENRHPVRTRMKKFIKQTPFPHRLPALVLPDATPEVAPEHKMELRPRPPKPPPPAKSALKKATIPPKKSILKQAPLPKGILKKSPGAAGQKPPDV